MSYLERKNQWIKQYLRLVSSTAPKDWMYWLALMSAMHNNQRNSMMGLSSNQVLLGYDITLNPNNISLMTVESAEEHNYVMMK
jgi:hypothetical protein